MEKLHIVTLMTHVLYDSEKSLCLFIVRKCSVLFLSQGILGAAGIRGPQGERGPTGSPGFAGTEGRPGPKGTEVQWRALLTVSFS